MKIGDLFNIEKGSLQSTKCVSGKYDFITAAEEWKTHKEYTHNCEALLFAAAASGSLGRTHYVNGKFIGSDLCFILTTKDNKNFPLDLKFYHSIFNSLRSEIVSKTKSGTSKEAISIGKFSEYHLPYFDIEHQKKWNIKLGKLNSNKDDLLKELYYQSDRLTKLRQQILQDAIQGKLISQDSNDEPASKLLERIKAKKEKLIKEKKIKKSKTLPLIKEEEIPFNIPESWIWCRLEEITTLITDGKHGDCQDESNSGYYFLSAKDLQNGEFIYDGARQINYDDFLETHRRTNLEPNDICVVNTGATVGKTVLVLDNELTPRTTFQKSVAVIKVVKSFINVMYIKNYIICRTPELLKTSRGSAINNLLLGDMKMMLFPLPPKNEQKRIVEKIEELLKVCDELEKEVKQNQILTQQLLQSALKEALEPKN